MSSNAEIMSLYIPYIPKHWGEESIRKLFEELRVGIVERVDFFDTGNWEWALSAFVHLKCWIFSDLADQIYNEVERGHEWCLDIPNQSGKYFVLKQMNCPKTPTTHLNIHQLAAKMEDMEQEIQTLRDERELLRTEVLATNVAESVLTSNDDMEVEKTGGFYHNYNDSCALSMADLVMQTEKFKQMFEESDLMDISSDEESVQSYDSATKRVRNSAELCGNN